MSMTDLSMIDLNMSEHACGALNVVTEDADTNVDWSVFDRIDSEKDGRQKETDKVFLIRTGRSSFEFEVPNFRLLRKRRWFLSRPYLHDCLSEVVSRGLGLRVDASVRSAHVFHDQLIAILRADDEARMAKLYKTVPNFCYLQTRGCFRKNPSVSITLEKVVDRGLGHRVNVGADDFVNHLWELLDDSFTQLDESVPQKKSTS